MSIKNQRDAIRQHVDDPCTAKHRTWVVTGIKKDGTAAKRWYKLTFVNENGFSVLVLGSKLPTAVKFKNWVTSDVLLQIRKTGGYIPVQQGESDEETIRHAEEILRATLKEKENLLKK
ncbi:BRO-N domain-containing protein [Segatella sp.]